MTRREFIGKAGAEFGVCLDRKIQSQSARAGVPTVHYGRGMESFDHLGQSGLRDYLEYQSGERKGGLQLRQRKLRKVGGE